MGSAGWGWREGNFPYVSNKYYFVNLDPKMRMMMNAMLAQSGADLGGGEWVVTDCLNKKLLSQNATEDCQAMIC